MDEWLHEQCPHDYRDPFEVAIAETFAIEHRLWGQQQRHFAMADYALRQQEADFYRSLLAYQQQGDEQLRELSGEGYAAIQRLDQQILQAQTMGIRAATWGGGFGF